MDNSSRSETQGIDRSRNLSEIYQGVLTLLIETDKKRDQILLFYSALVAALITYLSSDASKSSTPMILALCTLFVIFGIVLGVVIIIYRKWHSYYVKSLIILANLHVNNTDPQADIIQDLWKKNTFVPKKRPLLYRGAEWWIFNAYLTISIIPVVLTTNLFLTFLQTSIIIEAISLAVTVGITIFSVISYISLMHLLYKKFAEEPERKFNAKDCWVLRLNEVKPRKESIDS